MKYKNENKFAIQYTLEKGDMVYISQEDCDEYIGNFNNKRIIEETKFMFLGYKECDNQDNIDCYGCRGFFYLEDIKTGIKGKSCLTFTDKGIILQKIEYAEEFLKDNEFMI